jgi:tetratricopeptide (TPR) repeat protein
MTVMRPSMDAVRRGGGRGLRALAFAGLCLIAACDAGEKVSFDELLARAQTYREAGEFRASLIELKNALQKEPANAEARLLLARMELDLGDAVSAEIELQRARELGGPRDRVSLMLAEARLQLEQFDDMLRELRVEDDAAPERQVAIFNLRGRAHLALGQAILAEEAFKAALALDEKSVDALVGLTRLAYAKGDLAQGQNYLARATTAEPRNLVVLAIQGDVAFAARDHEAAERHFREILTQRKDDLAALKSPRGGSAKRSPCWGRSCAPRLAIRQRTICVRSPPTSFRTTRSRASTPNWRCASPRTTVPASSSPARRTMRSAAMRRRWRS